MCNGCVPRSSKQSNLISSDFSAFRIPARWDGVWIIAVHLFSSAASPKEMASFSIVNKATGVRAGDISED